MLKLPTNSDFMIANYNGNRQILQFVATIFIVFLFMLLGAIPIGLYLNFINPKITEIEDVLSLAVIVSTFLFAMIGLLLCIKLIYKKPIKSLFTIYEKFSFKTAFNSLFVFFVLVLTLDMIQWLLNPNLFKFVLDFDKFLPLFLAGIILIPIQTTCEELIFRSYLFQVFGGWFKNVWISIIVCSLLFAFAHFGNTEMNQDDWIWILLYFISVGLFLGVITAYDNNLERAIGIHAANNLYLFVVAYNKSSLVLPSVLYQESFNPIVSYFAYLMVMAMYIYVVYYSKSKKNEHS